MLKIQENIGTCSCLLYVSLFTVSKEANVQRAAQTVGGRHAKQAKQQNVINYKSFLRKHDVYNWSKKSSFIDLTDKYFWVKSSCCFTVDLAESAFWRRPCFRCCSSCFTLTAPPGNIWEATSVPEGQNGLMEL